VSEKQSEKMLVGQFEKIFPQRLKPKIIFARFMYGLKPVPFKLTHYRKDAGRIL
jgi:hypothetical protein